jgi:hypothetical protein
MTRVREPAGERGRVGVPDQGAGESAAACGGMRLDALVARVRVARGADDEVITAIGDLAASERQDRQVGAIPEGTNLHPPKIAAGLHTPHSARTDHGAS